MEEWTRGNYVNVEERMEGEKLLYNGQVGGMEDKGKYKKILKEEIH